ncbi:MAG TPA: hypothetical protein ENI23_15695 [bacterium]|nr:hypothetical protein [bacterium]
MIIQEYFYTLKVCGLRWFIWFVPIWFIIPLMQQFGGHEKFKDKYVNAVRLGNSGLFLIFSQEIQNKIRENTEKNRKSNEEEEKEEIIRKYKDLHRGASDE